jgi:HK97 gp10 family phage protein
VRVEVQMHGLEGLLDTLRRLPPEVVSKRGGPVRRAVAKAAALLRNEARKNFAAVTSSPGKTAKNWATGFTQKHIITKRKPIFGDGMVKGERYIVAVRYIKHPSARILAGSRAIAKRANSKHDRPTRYTKAKELRANDVAYMLEYGTSKQPAEPWLRPAFEAKKQEALQMMETHLRTDIDRIVKKLAAENRTR